MFDIKYVGAVAFAIVCVRVNLMLAAVVFDASYWQGLSNQIIELSFHCEK